jgi:UDP-glucuronate 4-epimerase
MAAFEPSIREPRGVLVTGAAGFVGFHMARRLLGRGIAVLGIDCLTDYYDVRLKNSRLDELARQPGFEFIRLDIADAAAFSAAHRAYAPDVMVHLAAQAGVRYSLTNPHAYAHSNLQGFLSVLEAVRLTPVKHLIYASSSSVYGANSKVPFCETDPVEQPVSLYSATKRANELMARTYAHLFKIPSSGLRFFTVYGPWGRPDMAYYSFAEAILAGRPIEVFNGGDMRRDFTYVDDVIEAIDRLMVRPPDAALRTGLALDESAPHVLYNVGNHSPVALATFIATIESALGMEAAKIMRPMQPGDVPQTYADVSRLARVTGFEPSTPLAAGIERFVTWLRAYSNGGGTP